MEMAFSTDGDGEGSGYRFGIGCLYIDGETTDFIKDIIRSIAFFAGIVIDDLQSVIGDFLG